MHRHIPEQRVRLASALLYVPGLIAVSHLVTGSWVPPFGLRGLWFYTALVGLLIARALVEPYFTRPADAIVNSVGLALTVIALDPAERTIDERYFIWGRAAFLGYATVVAVLSLTAILLKDSERVRDVAAWCSRQAARIGRADVMYSTLFLASVYATYSNAVTTVVSLVAAWAAVIIGRPLERVAGKVFSVTSSADGIPAVTYEDPGIAVAAFPTGFKPLRGTEVFQAGKRIGQVVDHTITAAVPRVRIALDNPSELIQSQIPLDTPPVPKDLPAIGFVREETTTDHLVFHLPSGTTATVSEGELVEAPIGRSNVLFQVTEARVVEHREFDVLRRVTRVEARKLGEWSTDSFIPVPWLPAPGALINRFVSRDTGQASPPHSIGHVPGTSYEIGVDPDPAITHNTAIVGILGSGKTRLAWRLVDEMLASGHKCIVVDITAQYAPRYAEYDAASVGDAFHHDVTEACKAKLHSTVLEAHGDSGNAWEFRHAIRERVSAFVEGTDRVLVIDPVPLSQAGSHRYGFPSGGRANIRLFSVPEVVRLIAEAGLLAMMSQSREFRLCLVLEEAHSLVPEWNARAADDEAEATNGTARSVMQGRKYGYGCLLVTQRTASVSKSILNQCNSMFAFRMYDATGADFLEHYIGGEYSRLLSSLQDRQVIAFGPASTCRAPIIIEVDEVRG
jgi:hypothetical protein